MREAALKRIGDEIKPPAARERLNEKVFGVRQP